MIKLRALRLIAAAFAITAAAPALAEALPTPSPKLAGPPPATPHQAPRIGEGDSPALEFTSGSPKTLPTGPGKPDALEALPPPPSGTGADRRPWLIGDEVLPPMSRKPGGAGKFDGGTGMLNGNRLLKNPQPGGPDAKRLRAGGR